jgi:hypothetical protein
MDEPMGLERPARYSPALYKRMELDPDGDWIKWEDFMDWYYTGGRHQVMLERENTKLKSQMALVLDKYKGVTTQASLDHMTQCMAGLPGPRCVLPRDHEGDHQFTSPTTHS